jgi:hypothetical protein
MRTLVVEVFPPGGTIIAEGDSGGDMFIIVASKETAYHAEVEIVVLFEGDEKFLTRLRRWFTPNTLHPFSPFPLLTPPPLLF